MSTTEVDITWRQACAAALASLQDLTPMRLAGALSESTPEEVWEKFGKGELVPGALLQANDRTATGLRAKWKSAVMKTNPLDVLEQYHSHDVSIWTPTETYPVRLLEDIARPEVLFWQGHAEALARPTVAIIGTRHCTPQGRDIARRFGAELAEAGVSVVSGLALGIDGAAHKGALEAVYGAPPIGVVGSGLNRVYPSRHVGLWQEVAESGLLISEAPLNAEPTQWRFPARNRIIAGLADIVLVVESHIAGGSLLTVNEAAERDVVVMAVPGSIRSPASKGTNGLLREGRLPAMDTEDVLAELRSMQKIAGDDAPEQQQFELDSPVDLDDVAVLEAIGWDASSTDDLLNRLDLSLGKVATALARLQQGGWVQNVDGWWHRC